MTLLPARLEPQFVQRIWGVRSLAPLFPEKSELADPVGEVWLTGNECRIANGPFAGKTLAEAWSAMPAEWAGTAARTDRIFPLLVKFLFPADNLSVQVHPNDGYARKNEAAAGGNGKTEMWYTISAEPDACVLVNLKPGVTPMKFREAIADGTAEKCLTSVHLCAEDLLYVPAGTVHTIGPGVVLCEVQQNSDITYRVYDYNRLDTRGKPRELHIEKALAVMNFGEQEGRVMEPVRLQTDGISQTIYVACRYFVTEKWEFENRAAVSTSPEHFDLFIVLDGAGEIAASGESIAYSPSQTWLVPAALGNYEFRPAKRTTLLRTYVPGSLDDFSRQLKARGVSSAEIQRVVRS